MINFRILGMTTAATNMLNSNSLDASRVEHMRHTPWSRHEFSRDHLNLIHCDV